MDDCTRKPGDEKEIREFGPDSIEMAMRLRIRDTIEELVTQELNAALGAGNAAGVSPWNAGADADDERGADDDRDAAGAPAANRWDEHRMAQRNGAAV
jgi:hypothetical protein